MPTDRLFVTTLALCALMLPGGHAGAFEPGATTTCKPSADGKDFICDAVDGRTHAGKARAPTGSAKARSEPVANAVEDTAVATAAPVIRASDLPDYLRHAPEPTVVRRPARNASHDAAGAQPAATEANSDLFTPPPAAIAHKDVMKATPVAEPAAAPAAERSPRRGAHAGADTRAPKSEPALAVPVSTPVPPVAPVAAVTRPQAAAVETPAPALPATTNRGVPSNGLASMAQFRQLPAQHYTLEVGKARSHAALQAQIDSFSGVTEPLYLLQLTTPDGDWYVLVLSDFPSTEAARAARSRLPATAAITSGFARRIGPLQAELAR